MENIIDIHDGHRERLRQRILNADIESLHPHELLEFILYFALPRQDVNDLAHALLDRFGSLRSIFLADPQEILAEMPEISEATLEWLRTLKHCFKTSLRDDLSEICLVNYADVFRHVRLLRRKFHPPCCIQLLADHEDFMLYRRPICFDRKWAQPERLQQALADVTASGAKKVYIAILTNEFMPIPSLYDREKVRSYAHILELSGSALMDVVLLGTNGICSMRRLDMIPQAILRRRRAAVREDPVQAYMRDMPAAEELSNPDSPFYFHTGGLHERPEPV